MGKIDVLSRGGTLRAPEVVDLAAAAGLDLAAAATLLAIESNGGRNVWGSDGVSTGGVYVKGSEVTQAAYLRYKDARSRLGAQGVGPTQLTSPGLQDRADARGGAWDWRVNCAVGFEILAEFVARYGMRGGFRAYNGTSAYADAAMRRHAEWTAALATARGENMLENHRVTGTGRLRRSARSGRRRPSRRRGGSPPPPTDRPPAPCAGSPSPTRAASPTAPGRSPCAKASPTARGSSCPTAPRRSTCSTSSPAAA